MAEPGGRKANHSGRIKADDVTGTKALQIVRDIQGAYRVYNTGENSFTVKPDSQPALILQKKASLDVQISNSITISQNGTTGTAVEGIYERIDSNKDMRGGRFRGSAKPPVTIANNRGSVVYRILNSGKRPFTVNGLTPDLEPKLSIDIVASTPIQLSRADNLAVEAIYDFLVPNSGNSRSGRFKVTLDKAGRHTIINLLGGATAHYRILNSGETAFQFRLSTNTGDGQEVQPEQSFDFAMLGGTIMGVSPMEDDSRIQGIYEYLGP